MPVGGFRRRVRTGVSGDAPPCVAGTLAPAAPAPDAAPPCAAGACCCPVRRIRDDAIHFFEPDRTRALTALAQAFAQIQRWDDAESAFAAARAAADDFPSEYHRANNLRNELHRAYDLHSLAQALAQARYWEDARDTTDAIPDKNYRAKSLSAIATALAQAGQLPQAISLRADLWRRAQTRDELLRLFVVPPELLRAYPGLGQAFLDSFAWVDAQLASVNSSRQALAHFW